MKQNIRLGYEIKMDDQFKFRPVQIEYWTDTKKFESHSAVAPFHYHADLITGLSLVLMNPYLKTPLMDNSVDFAFCRKAWSVLEPHHQVYSNIHTRVEKLKRSFGLNENTVDKKHVESFEKNLNEILASAQEPWGLNLNSFQELVDAIFHLESNMQMPLIYNLKFSLSSQTIEKLHHLHALLFHLRAVIGLDYNVHVSDPTFEAVKVDAILDYVPRSEYVCQDAVLYWKFKNFAAPYSKNEDKTFQNLVGPTLQAFKNHSHNAYYLIENLPQKFLSSLAPEQLSEALHLVQMDWLLGTEAGLLYKIREELYGVLGGYEKLFWPEENLKPVKASNLTISCQLSEQELNKYSKAA